MERGGIFTDCRTANGEAPSSPEKQCDLKCDKMSRGEEQKEEGRGESRGQLDPEIATWILEFMIRQPVPDLLINRLLVSGAVPVPTDPRLKRVILLRNIDAELANGSVSEITLDALETLDRMGHAGTAPALRAAYCAAAVECAVRYLGGSPSRMGQGRFLEAVERVWRVRVGKLEAAGSDLVGDDLREWRDDVEAAVWNTAAARRLAERNTRNEAVRLVGEYLEEALAELGPPFLEVVARELKERKEEYGPGAGKGNLALDALEEGNVGLGEGRMDDPAVELGVDASRRAGKEVQKAVHRRVKHVASGRRKRRATVIVESVEEDDASTGSGEEHEPDAGKGNMVLDAVGKENVGPGAGFVNDRAVELGVNSSRPVSKEVQKTGYRRVKHVASCRHERVDVIVESERDDDASTGNKYDTLPSNEVNKVKNALKSSAEELHNTVKDPLPGALLIAERLAAKMGESVANGVELTENHGDVPDHAANPSCSYVKDAPKQSLLERNDTAHVYQWEDSIDDSPDTATPRVVRRRLNTPKNHAVSPLKKYEIRKFAKRKPVRRWSVEEEDALREAVLKYGKGNWKLILNSSRGVFEERTEVDLKDKWRNMTK